MDDERVLRIVLQRPPAGVDFGIQKGKGSHYETMSKQRSSGNDNVVLEVTVGLKQGDFSGPFVQGRPGERFIYVDVGTFAGQADSCWSRRLKVPLTSIAKRTIAKSHTFETTVPGTAADGGPACGSAKDVDWRVAS